MKIISWNVNSVRARIDNILNYIKDEKPDILLLQEIKTQDQTFPYDIFKEIGYTSHVFGQKSYNGVAIISKTEINKISKGFIKDDLSQSRIITGEISFKNKTITLINIYFENQHISPYFIILLFWYPCFELLFSMIRRALNKIKTYEPDTAHIHQLIYKKVKKKFNRYNNLTIHFLTNSMINLYNLGCFVIASNFIYNSEIIILMIFVNISFYIVLYKYLKK